MFNWRFTFSQKKRKKKTTGDLNLVIENLQHKNLINNNTQL